MVFTVLRSISKRQYMLSVQVSIYCLRRAVYSLLHILDPLPIVMLPGYSPGGVASLDCSNYYAVMIVAYISKSCVMLMLIMIDDYFRIYRSQLNKTTVSIFSWPPPICKNQVSAILLLIMNIKNTKSMYFLCVIHNTRLWTKLF